MDWYNLTKKYNNVGYKLGSTNINEGLDCLTTVLLFMKDIGKDVNNLLNGTEGFIYNKKYITINNYKNCFQNKKEMSKILFNFIKDKCIKVNRLQKGYICICGTNLQTGIGIYLGQGTLMMVYNEYGVKKIKIKNVVIKGIYKWVGNSQHLQ